MRVTTLIGVYDAKGTVLGEISYVLRKIAGRGHCPLCDITHSWVGRRRSFDECAATLGTHIDLYHLDDQPEEVRALSAGRTPLIVAALEDGSLHELMSTSDLARCEGSPASLVEAIKKHMHDRGWSS
jgi:hypothetical protein